MRQHRFILSPLALAALMAACEPSDVPDANGTPEEDVVTSSHALVTTLPRRVQAEAPARFRDNDTFHWGNCGSGPVDAETTSDVGGGCHVAFTNAGEWLEYDIQVPSQMTVDLVLRLASQSTGKTVHVEVDGVRIGSALSAPARGWQTFENRTISSLPLGAGAHTVRVVFDTGAVNLNYLDFLPRAFTVPARVEAEYYQRALELTPTSNTGGACNRGDGVDKQLTSDTAGGECNITGTDAGEWLEYDLKLPRDQTLDITARVASASTARTFHLEIDGQKRGPSFTAPSGGAQAFGDRIVPGVALSAGSHTLRVVFENGGVNLNYLDVRARPTNATVAVYLPRTVRSCFIGDPCDPATQTGCVGLFEDGNRSTPKEGFTDATFRAVKTSSPERATAEKEICLSMALTDQDVAEIKAEVALFKNNVRAWSNDAIRLTVFYIEIADADMSLSRWSDGMWVSPDDLEPLVRERLTFAPDFNLVIAPIRDASRLLHYSVPACGGTYGADRGLAGGSYSWVPRTKGSVDFDCAMQPTFTHEWLHQVHYDYQELSGFNDLYGDDLPACRQGAANPKLWFPDSHQCGQDPDFERCGMTECGSNDLVNAHILGAHWDPSLKFVANHCKNGVQDFAETGVDVGGPCVSL